MSTLPPDQLDALEVKLHMIQAAISSRRVIDSGYCGHHFREYEWQARQLIPLLEDTLRMAAELPPIADNLYPTPVTP